MQHSIENYSERDLFNARWSSYVSYQDKIEIQAEILRRRHDEQCAIASILPINMHTE